MKPQGTITMYFPFLDSKTRDILQDIMEQETNYHDFVHALNHRIHVENSTDLVVFFATHHAVVLFDFNLLDRIATKYGKLPIIRPNLFIASAFQGRKEDIQRAREAVDLVLADDHPVWLILEMLVTKLEAEILGYPTIVHDSTTFDIVQSMLDKYEKLRFFNSRFYHALFTQALRDGDIETAINHLDNAIQNAQEHDDLNRLARLFRDKAGLIQSKSMKDAMGLLQKARDILEPMGDKNALGNTLFQMSRIYAIRGEYDKAIENNIETISLRQRIGPQIGHFEIMISTMFNAIGDASAGLEWARMAEVETQLVHRPRAILNQVWALILQRKLTEALVILDEIREPILKSGLESHLAALYLVNGILELTEEDFSGAAVSFEEALGIYERRGSQMSVNICAHHLAKTEVYAAELSGRSSISPWLSMLEEKAISEDWPGILGQVIVLKAKFYLMQNETDQLSFELERLSALIQESNLIFLQGELDTLMERAW